MEPPLSLEIRWLEESGSWMMNAWVVLLSVSQVKAGNVHNLEIVR